MVSGLWSPLLRPDLSTRPVRQVRELLPGAQGIPGPWHRATGPDRWAKAMTTRWSARRLGTQWVAVDFDPEKRKGYQDLSLTMILIGTNFPAHHAWLLEATSGFTSGNIHIISKSKIVIVSLQRHFFLWGSCHLETGQVHQQPWFVVSRWMGFAGCANRLHNGITSYML